jgi:hypothetical protein
MYGMSENFVTPKMKRKPIENPCMPFTYFVELLREQMALFGWNYKSAEKHC